MYTEFEITENWSFGNLGDIQKLHRHFFMSRQAENLIFGNDETRLSVFVASLANVNTELVLWCWRNCVDETVVLLFIFENLEKTQMCSDSTALGKRDKNGFVLLTNYPRGFCVEQSHFSPRSLYFLLLLSNQPEYTVWVLFLTLARARPVYKNVCGMYVFKCNVWTEIISERVLKQNGD